MRTMKGVKQISAIVFMLSIALFLMNASRTPMSVNGFVYDELGSPLIGASIIEKGTKNGTITDFDGAFTLEVSTNLANLEVSYIGYDTKEVDLRKLDLTIPQIINLVANQAQLEEIVVTSMARPKLFKRNRSEKIKVAHTSNFIVQFPTSEVDDIQFNTEDYDKITENSFLRSLDKPVSTFSIDVDAASYSNLRRFIDNGQAPPKDAVRIEEMINYFDYTYPQPTGEDPFAMITEYSDCPWNTDHKLMHIGLQGKEIPKDDLPASNLVFLCDVSGSMSHPNKLPLLQSALKMLVNNLRPEDKVSLVTYAGGTRVVLKPTSGKEKGKIRAAIDGLMAGGGTSGAAGIKLAYQQAQKAFIEGGNNRVIISTDGDFNMGQSSDAELQRLIEKERGSGVFLSVLGYGTGNYKDNKMEKIANNGNGNYAYIDNINEARKVLVTEFGGTLFTIAKDVKLQIEFNPTYVGAYRLIGYENRMLAREDFNDDKKDAGELGAGHTVTAIYEIIPAGVESEFVKSVDPLKYQNVKEKPARKYADELMTLKLRYKQPDGDTSKLITSTVSPEAKSLDQTSDNYRWSATVAGFGMLLRDSEYKQDASYEKMIAMGKKATGEDKEGYRAEMIKMMKNVVAIEGEVLEASTNTSK